MKRPRSAADVLAGHVLFEMQAGMRELLTQLDGSRAARFAMLAGLTREEPEAAGSVQEDG
jgi:hypothetical protein